MRRLHAGYTSGLMAKCLKVFSRALGRFSTMELCRPVLQSLTLFRTKTGAKYKIFQHLFKAQFSDLASSPHPYQTFRPKWF